MFALLNPEVFFFKDLLNFLLVMLKNFLLTKWQKLENKIEKIGKKLEIFFTNEKF